MDKNSSTKNNTKPENSVLLVVLIIAIAIFISAGWLVWYYINQTNIAQEIIKQEARRVQQENINITY